MTDYCIYPADQVTGKVRVGGTKNPRLGAIRDLEPDLVIANMEENRRQDVEALEAAGVPVFVTFARTVRAAIDEMHTLAKLVHTPEAEEMIAPIEAAWAYQTSKKRTSRARVFCPIWRDPWMTANGDTYISDLIETCGGTNVFAERERHFPLAADVAGEPGRIVEGADTRYPRVSLEEAAALRPDVILLPDEPYRFAEKDAADIRAVRGLELAHIHLIDGTLISWYGIRIGKSISTLARIIELV